MLTSGRCFIARESGEFSKMGKQMRSRKTETVHSSTAQETSWRSIDWKKARCEVRRLQMRIAKAVELSGCSNQVSLLKRLSRMTGNCHVRF